MIAPSFSASVWEALALGLATGPVCLASCGPIVVPWMLILPNGWRVRSHQLTVFLTARLMGYLLFACAAWWAGSAIPHAWGGRAWAFGCVQLLLAIALVIYSLGWPKTRSSAADRGSRLIQIGAVPQHGRTGAATLGFLTGINLCPPFLVAGVRAAQLGSLPSALIFFVLFFAGTAVWFAPFLALGLVQRNRAIATVARITAALLACYYGFLGASTLIARIFYV